MSLVGVERWRDVGSYTADCGVQLLFEKLSHPISTRQGPVAIAHTPRRLTWRYTTPGKCTAAGVSCKCVVAISSGVSLSISLHTQGLTWAEPAPIRA